MYKLVVDNDIKLDYCDVKFNNIPTPFEIITEDKYRELKYRWHNEYHDFSQVFSKEQLKQLFGEEGGYANAYFEYNTEYGVAEVIRNYDNKRAYVKIGCKHEWELIESDSYTYVHKCKKCGTINEVPTGR